MVKPLLARPEDESLPDPVTIPERFAIPYSFKPRLTLAEAFISVCGAFLRILLGSTLFGVWGTYSFLAWSSIHNLVLRSAALLALVSAFALAMTGLMLAISAGVRLVWPAPPRQPQKSPYV